MHRNVYAAHHITPVQISAFDIDYNIPWFVRSSHSLQSQISLNRLPNPSKAENIQSNVPSPHDPSPSQILSSSPKAYNSTPSPSEESTYSPITSQDWHEIEANIDPVPPREWLDSDSPVPLNKDWPISQAEFNILPPEEKSRLANEDLRRKKLDFLRQEKLQDHNHLHPFGEPFTMPMVAPHRGYAPEGTTPPPIQKIPWQLRRPWSWIRTGGIALCLAALLAAVAAWVIQHQDEWKLRNLEKKNPAPQDWTEKARGYYAVALHHRKEGEIQLAVWALQRAIVEAGYRWVIEPANVPEEERISLDLANAWVIRTLVTWEIELEHWDKAISLMEGLSTAYVDENSLNHARRSDLLRILALPTEKTKGVQSANAMFQTAIAYAGYELPKNPKDPIILPEGMQGNALLLRVLEEYIIFQIQHGLKSAKQALPTLLSIANVYRQTPHNMRDVCAEGLVMLHIGEIMYALGHQDESIQWTERAVQSTRKARKNQSTDEDRQRCSECVGNGSNSLGILYEVDTLCTLADVRNVVILSVL